MVNNAFLQSERFWTHACQQPFLFWKMSYYNQLCLAINKLPELKLTFPLFPAAVDVGTWGSWGAFGECPANCGEVGLQNRTRDCSENNNGMTTAAGTDVTHCGMSSSGPRSGDPSVQVIKCQGPCPPPGGKKLIEYLYTVCTHMSGHWWNERVGNYE